MVGNFSTNPETFFAYCLIDSAGGRLYRDSVRVDNLPPFDSIPVSFTEWTPDGLGNIYDITVYTALIGDQNPPNDTLKMSTYTFEETTRIPAGWAFSAPAVDGLIETPEWQSAFKVDMSNIYGKYGTAPFPVGSVYAYAMNDSDYLYLAFDCISDNAYQATDNPGIFLDDSHNHQWPAYPDTTEGLNTWQPGIRWASLWFCQGDTGTWRYPRPFPMEVSISSGRMQFEGAIPLGNSVDPAYLDAALGDSAGVFLKYWDEIEGHQGWWPQGSDSIKPLQFGDLILAICPGVLEHAKSQLPMTKSQLLQNCPNPFTHATTITYSLASAVGGLPRAQSSRQRTAVSLRVYDLCGRLVWTLVDGEQEPGFYKVRWDGRSLSGRRAAPGMYFYRIRAGDFESTRKMVLVK